MAKFDAKKWASEATGPSPKVSAILRTPGLPEALEVIGREIAAGRSSATYPLIQEEVVKGVFGLEMGRGGIGDYMRKHMPRWREQEASKEVGSE